MDPIEKTQNYKVVGIFNTLQIVLICVQIPKDVQVMVFWISCHFIEFWAKQAKCIFLQTSFPTILFAFNQAHDFFVTFWGP